MIHTIDLHFHGQKEAIAAFVVETAEGPALVETGPFSTFPRLREGLEALGYQPEDIKHVFLTHIHLDHAGAAWRFAQQGAKVYVHPKGYRHLVDPSKLMGSAKRIYQDLMDSLWGGMEAIPEDRLVQMEHGAVVKVGDTDFTAWYTPGHAVHHIAWEVDEALFSGDVGGVKIKDGPVIPPCPPPDIHVEDWQDSIRLIKGLGIQRMFLTHYGEVRDVHSHLEDLEGRLLRWAAWMKPHFEEGTSPSDITFLFQDMVKEELLASGITDEVELASYEVANPSWMSVAGLLRYWKKWGS
jgi:glyoxylase-like metal-dependent hydrolase (beta-lactamase superfamily II)